MKNGKKPTLAQKKFMKEHGLVPENWLIVKDIKEYMEVVSWIELKKIGASKKKTKKLYKESRG